MNSNESLSLYIYIYVSPYVSISLCRERITTVQAGLGLKKLLIDIFAHEGFIKAYLVVWIPTKRDQNDKSLPLNNGEMNSNGSVCIGQTLFHLLPPSLIPPLSLYLNNGEMNSNGSVYTGQSSFHLLPLSLGPPPPLSLSIYITGLNEAMAEVFR